VLGSLVVALLVPYVTLGHTLLYFDLGARQAEEPAKPRRRWLPWWRRRPTPAAPQPAPGIAASE
jgi:hypothetical protein